MCMPLYCSAKDILMFMSNHFIDSPQSVQFLEMIFSTCQKKCTILFHNWLCLCPSFHWFAPVCSVFGNKFFSFVRKRTILFHNCLWHSLSSYSFLLLQVRYEEIISDSAYLDGILVEGATKASDIADTTLNNVYQAMGFLQRWAERMLQEESMWKDQ